MTTHSGLKKLAHCFGPETDLAWVRWAPTSDATQTLTEAHGVGSITRTGSLAELIALANEMRTDYTAHLVQGVHSVADTTNTVTTATATIETEAITMANEMKSDYGAHRVDVTSHPVADATNTITAANADAEAELVALANDVRSKYIAHLTQATVHDVNDAVNTIASSASTNLSTAITLLNQLRTAYTAHLTQATVHAVNDAVNTLTSPAASNRATAVTLANELKAKFNLHRVEATVHTVSDAVNVVAVADVTEAASLVTLVNQLKSKLAAHRTQATVHAIDDDKNTVATADATDTASAITLINALKAAYNLHLGQLAHKVADSTNVLTLAAATNLATAVALLNELRTVYAAHRVSTTHHDNADATNTVASGACTDRETAVTLANQLKTAYVAHRTQATRHPTNDDLNNVSAVLNVTGCYRLNLKQKGGTLFPLVGRIDNGTTKFHFLDVVAIDAANGWVDVRHRDVAYANVANGPAASDTVDELCALIIQPRGNVIRSGAKHRLKTFGPRCEIAYARWAPSADATQTLTEAHGVTGIARTGAGAWTVTLDSSCEAMVVLIAHVENDTSHYHFADVLATNASAGTFTARHGRVAYASVASGPSDSDTVDQIEVLVLKRMST